MSKTRDRMRAMRTVKQATGERVARHRPFRPTVRERLEERLRVLGWTVEPGHALRSVTGWYRVNQKYDDTIVCWETWARRSGDLFPHHLVSYDTMSACARGCEVGQIEDVWWVTALALPRVKPVTDPHIDAPDGAEVDGYVRRGNQWCRRP